ncbi:hypothetical protein KFL_004760040 [Klebsormidium nitens]|uniref:SET domain-containing protein n=1 Tax=Klebsormidium nitens TaxID=105231 RepID=A0A1Y1IHL9_KLENI|nr:hypothetical protein KFL_004760040 [Klebsormidium nitens]|eukprot:GAQ88989.1 hypothetical protein KFL_004760040 [Klebsormidium nitens]
MVVAVTGPERDPKYFSLHQHVELRDSRLGGMGLFATAGIKEGEVIWSDDTYNADKYLHTLPEIKSWPSERQREFMHYAYQIEEETFAGVGSLEIVRSDASNYMNHSCDPNCWFLTEDPARMLARRAMKAGEEITFDYATSETTDFRYQISGWESCLCGSKNCRGKLLGSDYQRPDVRKRYEGHFMPYVQRLIERGAAAGEEDKL